MAAVNASFFRMSATRKAFMKVLSTGYASIDSQLPPAASIFWRADFEKACARTVSAYDSSPSPSTLTGIPLRVARPLRRRLSGVTSAPLSKRCSRSVRLTGWVRLRNCSNGIDFFMVGPRSLRMRMWIGFWPPSKFTRVLLPEREPAPFWPRPEVLPTPEPSPRPTRLRCLREPGAGLRECSPMRSSATINLHQVAHGGQLALELRRIGALGGLPDPAQLQGAQRVALLLARLVGRAHLGDLQVRGHQLEGASAGAASSLEPPSRPSTSRTVRPRSSATCSGLRRSRSAAIVARTRLIGFWLPRLFESTSWIPASSSTARTPPPAITPVPAEAGLSSTRAAPWRPITSWVMVEPCIGTL